MTVETSEVDKEMSRPPGNDGVHHSSKREGGPGVEPEKSNPTPRC